MNLRDDKKEILTTIGSYVSFTERSKTPNSTDLFPSVNNKNDIVSYLIDVLKIVAGSDAVKDLTGEMFANFLESIEPKLKNTVIKQLTQPNFNNNLPTYFLTGNEGVNIPVKNIDIYSKLKTNPNSNIGNLLYDENNKNFDNFAYDAILNNGTSIIYNNLILNYDNVTDTMNFQAVGNANTTIGEWLGNYVNDAVFINKKEFLSNTINSIFGTITSDQGKTKEQVFQELQIQKMIEQLIDDEDDSFVINQNDFEELLKKAQELIDGVTYNDLGCGILETSLALTGLTNYISLISGSTDSYENKEQTNSVLNDVVLDGKQKGNRSTIEDNFFQKLIKNFTLQLISIATTSPQIRVLMGLISAFTNNGISEIGNPIDDLKNFKILIKCIKNDLLKLINEFIFNTIKRLLNVLLKPVINEIIREKINQYLGIIKNLTTI